jgi:DNA mismatch endonuclease (patch repair protein)
MGHVASGKGMGRKDWQHCLSLDYRGHQDADRGTLPTMSVPVDSVIDPLTPIQRSERMSRVRGSGNESTEEAVAAMLAEAGIFGWQRHPKGMLGRPDFYFPDSRLVLFVDGCFWHACPACKRRNPAANADFWRQKIDDNRRRDTRQRRRLRANGYHVMRVWEHETRQRLWLRRVRAMLTRIRHTLPSTH